MTPLTTKAAEIRAGLVAELRAACVGHPNASIAWPHRVLHKAAALIEQQAAELAEARAENERLVELTKFWIDDSVAAHRAHTTAESERDELLREKERLGAGWRPIETAPTDYTHVIGMDAKGNVSRTWFFAPSSMTRDWLKVPGRGKWKPIYWMPLPLPPEDSGQILADANSKSPDPNSQSERIAGAVAVNVVAEARLRYNRYTDNHPTIHSNLFPSWGELSAADRRRWLDEARAALPKEPPALAPIGEAGR